MTWKELRKQVIYNLKILGGTEAHRRGIIHYSSCSAIVNGKRIPSDKKIRELGIKMDIISDLEMIEN